MGLMKRLLEERLYRTKSVEALLRRIDAVAIQRGMKDEDVPPDDASGGSEPDPEDVLPLN